MQTKGYPGLGSCSSPSSTLS